jgi:raffinose/stachyose/melibiose transport system permease protein
MTRAQAAPFDPARLYAYLFLLLIAGLVLVPLLATALGGFKTLGDLRANAFALPSPWVFENYWGILTGSSSGACFGTRC